MISLIQTAEGALNETHSILQRMRELAVQSSNDTNNNVDRKELQKEMNQLLEEIDRISNNTEFNTKGLLDGSFKGKFHIGANEGQSIELEIANMSTSKIGEGTGYESTGAVDVSSTDFSDNSSETISVQVGGETTTVTLDQNYDDEAAVLAAVNSQLADTGVRAELNDAGDAINLVSTKAFSVEGTEAGTATIGETINNLTVDTDSETTGGILTQADADKAITSINNAIESVSAERSKLGAYQNRLEHTINNLGASAENLTAAESRIRDTDMAKEMMEFTKNNILTQAAQAMLAQFEQVAA